MKPVEPVLTVELFPKLSGELLSLLKGLSAQEWEMPTACSPWVVKDVAAHLLGSNIGRLSSGRDTLSESDSPGMSFEELIGFINQANAEWVRAAKGMSPSLLIELLDLTDAHLYRYFKTLPAHAIASTPVSWADDRPSPNWFDIAREYTEKWLHQQHIREAVGRPLLTTWDWLFPVLDTFMRALPRTYRGVQAEEGAAVVFRITGDAGGEWSLVRDGGAWKLFSGGAAQAESRVGLDQDVAWRLFTKGMDRDVARSKIRIEGDPILGAEILNMVSIMA